MKIKEGIGWKAGYNEEKGLYGAEVIFRGSWDLYEITAGVFSQLSANTPCGEAEKLIASGRRLYAHANDECGPAYNIVFDDGYADYCPWAAKTEPAGRTWDENLTDAAVEVFESEKANREQRRKKRESRLKK